MHLVPQAMAAAAWILGIFKLLSQRLEVLVGVSEPLSLDLPTIAVPCPAYRTALTSADSVPSSVAAPLCFGCQALDTLTKNDISEVKGMKAPPLPVRLVMEAVCVLKSLKPTKIKDPSTGRWVPACRSSLSSHTECIQCFVQNGNGS